MCFLRSTAFGRINRVYAHARVHTLFIHSLTHSPPRWTHASCLDLSTDIYSATPALPLANISRRAQDDRSMWHSTHELTHPAAGAEADDTQQRDDGDVGEFPWDFPACYRHRARP